jgi:hypothetical protein
MPSTSLTINAGQTQTYESVLRALATAGAAVKSQIPPQRAHFTVSEKAWGFPTGIEGDVGVQPAGDGRSIVTVETKLSSGTVLVIAAIGLVALFLALAVWGGFGFMLWLVAVGLQVWVSGVSAPGQAQRRIENAIHATAGSQVAAGAVAVAPAVITPPAPPQAPTAPVPAAPIQSGPARDSGDDVYTQIKKLSELKAAGALTSEEFDAKKAELLKRI